MEKATRATLGLLLSPDGKVLMARKTRGDGAGRMNFPGGKPEEEDLGAMRRCLIRECQQEVGFVPEIESLELVGKLRFYFASEFKWEVEVFVSRCWQESGQAEGDDMKDPVWLKFSDLPYDQMWAGDREWLPRVLSGQKVDADIYYDASHKVLELIKWSIPRF